VTLSSEERLRKVSSSIVIQIMTIRGGRYNGLKPTLAVRQSKFYLVARANFHHKNSARLCTLRRTTPDFLGCAESVDGEACPHSQLDRAAARFTKDASTTIGSYAPDWRLTLFVTVKSGVVRHSVAWRAGLCPHQQSALGRLKSLGRFFVGGSPYWGWI